MFGNLLICQDGEELTVTRRPQSPPPPPPPPRIHVAASLSVWSLCWDFFLLLCEKWSRFFYILIVPPKNTIGIWVSIAKEPFMESEKSNRIMKLTIFQWRPHMIWPSSHKEIWIFVKQVIGPLLPSFVTWLHVTSTGRLCSQKTGLQTYSNFMHTFLRKVVPDNLKACQICTNHVNNTFHKDRGQ